jgi:hypothetical protein
MGTSSKKIETSRKGRRYHFEEDWNLLKGDHRFPQPQSGDKCVAQRVSAGKTGSPTSQAAERRK